MNLYDRVLSKGTRLVAPMMAPLGAAMLGMDLMAVREDATMQLQALEALQERFSPDMVFPFMDTSPEALVASELLGADFRNAAVSVQEIFAWIEKLDDVMDVDPEDYPAMLSRLEMAGEMVERFNVPVAAFASGPYHLAGRLFGREEMLMWAVSDEACASGIIEFTTRLLSAYLQEMAQVVDLVMLVEPDSSTLTSAFFESTCHPYLQGLASIIRKSGAAPGLHLCGDSRHMLDHITSIGVECVSFDSPVDLRLAAEALPLNLVILGNLDTRRLELSSPADVRDKARRLLKDMADYRNFVLSTGCETAPDTPLENVAALFEAVRG